MSGKRDATVEPGGAHQRQSNRTSFVAAALAVAAFLIFPIVLGPLAMLQANKALQRGEHYARPAMLLAIAALLLGIYQAYLVVTG